MSKEVFYKKIQKIVKLENISVAEFGRKTNIDYQIALKIHNNKSKPKYQNFANIVKAYPQYIKYLFDLDEIPEQKNTKK
jgi:predicted transcriptional regulator